MHIPIIKKNGEVYYEEFQLLILISILVFVKHVELYLRHYILNILFISNIVFADRHCDVVVRVPGYRCRGPGFDSRHYQTF
jgi:hypothetical protein